MVGKCKVCGKEFKKKGNQKYCGVECRKIGKAGKKRKGKKSFERECLFCGEPFTTARENKVYCSKECRREMLKSNRREYYREHRTELNEYGREYRSVHKKTLSEYRVKYYRDNGGYRVGSSRSQVHKRKTPETDPEQERQWEREMLKIAAQRRKWNREVDQSVKMAGVKPRRCGFDGPCYDCPFPDCEY